MRMNKAVPSPCLSPGNSTEQKCMTQAAVSTKCCSLGGKPPPWDGLWRDGAICVGFQRLRSATPTSTWRLRQLMSELQSLPSGSVHSSGQGEMKVKSVSHVSLAECKETWGKVRKCFTQGAAPVSLGNRKE